MNKKTHPEYCYVLLKTEGGSVGVVKWGENGYYRTDLPAGYTEEDVILMNESLGVSDAEAQAMVACSMNEKLKEDDLAWEKKYSEILSLLKATAPCVPA